MKTLALAIAIVGAAVAVPAAAQSYNLATDFGSPVFTYGSAAADGSFTSFGAPTNCSDIGVSSTCYRGTADRYQIVADRMAPSILVHPAPGDTSGVQFTAPTTSQYVLNLLFQRGDSGDGVDVFGFQPGVARILLGTVNAANPTFSYQFVTFLNANQSAGFVIGSGAAGNYFGDSTFVSGTIAAVPESATWAMMLTGFGMVGFGLRRRRRSVAVRATYA